MWEIAPFYYEVRSTSMARWLDRAGSHGHLGSQRIQDLAHMLCPGVPAKWHPSLKMEQHRSIPAPCPLTLGGEAQASAAASVIPQQATEPATCPGTPGGAEAVTPVPLEQRPLIPLGEEPAAQVVTVAPSWAHCWAFCVQAQHKPAYAKGKCWEVKKTPCWERKKGELVAVLISGQGVKDIHGCACQQVWGLGRWAGCHQLRRGPDFNAHFQHHRVTEEVLKRLWPGWAGDPWVWKLTDLRPLPQVEYVPHEPGTRTWRQLQDEHAHALTSCSSM